MTFYLKCHTLRKNFGIISGKEHTSAEYAKAELKQLYKTGKINTPSYREYAVVGEDGLVYHIFVGIEKGGRFKWEWYPR